LTSTAHGDLPEGWLELQQGVNEDTIGEGDARVAGAGPAGEHELHHLLSEHWRPPAARRLSATCMESGRRRRWRRVWRPWALLATASGTDGGPCLLTTAASALAAGHACSGRFLRAEA